MATSTASIRRTPAVRPDGACPAGCVAFEPMCGICGVLVSDGVPDAAAVDRMRAALVHRGPDEGATTSLGRCALGHQRLRVLDLETGPQPDPSASGDHDA